MSQPWAFWLADIRTDELINDVTSIVQTATISPRLNRPMSGAVTLPADQSLIRGLAFDGDQKLATGRRTIKAFRNGVLRANLMIWGLDYSGDTDTVTVQVNLQDPLITLTKQFVQSVSGDLIDPVFVSPISGATIIKDSITNAMSNDSLGLPIDFLNGNFDLASPPAVDLSAYLTGWPVTIGDLITLLTNTGVVDVYLRPIDTAGGHPAGLIAQLDVVNQHGVDRTGTLSLDYDTGLRNVAAIRRSFDMDELCNKLYYYLGPPIAGSGGTQWQGNITATEPALSAYLALEMASRMKYGVYRDTSFYDQNSEDTVRPMFHELWKEEVRERVKPRELLYVTPAADGTFQPFDDFDIGDIVTVNTSDIVGSAIGGSSQRIYGYDVNIGADGVERVGELITSQA